MKRTILSLIICLCTVVATYAQTQQTHVIQRGETLSTIAKKYGLSEEQLKAANPDTQEFFYVGMKLVIPTVTQSVTSSSEIIVQEGSPQYDQVRSQNNSEDRPISTKSMTTEFVECGDVTFYYQSKSKVYGIGVGIDAYDYFAISWGIASDLRFGKNETSSAFAYLGVGARYRTIISDVIMVGTRLYPYAGWIQTNQPKIIEIGQEAKESNKFTYGAALEIQTGLKLFTNKNGTSHFLSVGYKLDASEFETRDIFKFGYFSIGISWTI